LCFSQEEKDFVVRSLSQKSQITVKI